MAALATFCMLVLAVVLCVIVVLFFGNPVAMMVTGNTFKLIMGIVGYVAILCALSPLWWSFITMFLPLLRDGEISIGNLTNGYRDIGRIVWGYILGALCQAVVSLPFYAIGLYFNSSIGHIIINLISYAIMVVVSIYFLQFAYILFDDEDISAYNALGRSAELMKGHKLQYFIIMLILIVCITVACIIIPIIASLISAQYKVAAICISLVLIFLFALPYVATVNAHFYESLIEKEDVSEEQPEGDYEEITNE